MSSNSFLVITHYPLKMVFDRPTTNTGRVNIHCETNDFSLVINFLTASLIHIYNELDLDYSLNLSTENVVHGLTFDELQSVLQFYGFANVSVCEETV